MFSMNFDVDCLSAWSEVMLANWPAAMHCMDHFKKSSWAGGSLQLTMGLAIPQALRQLESYGFWRCFARISFLGVVRRLHKRCPMGRWTPRWTTLAHQLINLSVPLIATWLEMWQFLSFQDCRLLQVAASLGEDQPCDGEIRLWLRKQPRLLLPCPSWHSRKGMTPSIVL